MRHSLFGHSFLPSIGCTLLLTGLLDLVASPALGQQSRTDEIAQKQAEKNAQLTPNTPTATERALNWFEAHFTDPNTVYLTFGGIYPAGGFAPGVAVRGAFGHARLNVGGAYSLRSYKLAHASTFRNWPATRSRWRRGRVGSTPPRSRFTVSATIRSRTTA